MKKLLVFLLLFGASIHADDRIRDAQAELKRQGFYYGEIDGQAGAEMTAAIRRFQIRNGLEVTGQLNTPTMDALDTGSTEENPPAAPQPPKQRDPTPPPPEPEPRMTKEPAPPVNIRRDESVEESDRAFLRRETTRRTPPPDDESIVPPPRPIPEPTADLEMLFAQTPFATAPRGVQEQTLRRAQSLLAQRGFYRDEIDGQAGPATEEALLTFQRSKRLQLTGRLDLATLGELRLLPGRTPIKPFNPPPTPPRVYRGVIVE
jgi:peptidoglycan hydrolase-like protein with peptidoglycan-binding domain